MASVWVGAIVWLSVGLYGYLILHHLLQALFSQQRRLNLLLVGCMLFCLVFSIIDSQLYRSTPDSKPLDYWLSVGQFIASCICAAFFVHIVNELFQIGVRRLVCLLWLALIPLTVLSLLGWVITPTMERTYLPLVGLYYQHASSTLLGIGFTFLYLGGVIAIFLLSFRRWHILKREEKAVLAALSLVIPLVVVDIAVYYGLLRFVPTWNFGYWVIATALSIDLNSQIYRLSKQLEQANRELQASYQYMVEQERLSAVGQVVRGIVHDLKNFFNTIQSLADVGVMRLTRDPTFSPADYLANISQTTRKAHDYLLDLLAMTKEAGDLQLEEVEVAQLVQEVARLSGARLLQPPIEIVNHIPPSLRVVADRRALMQMFLNLTLNAIQAMRHWQGERRIEFDWVEHPEQTILVVRDTGPGMPSAVRENLFSQMVTTKHGGSGIGLMLVKRAADKHSATLEVFSEPDNGTTFVCTFPTPPKLVKMGEQIAVA